MSDDVVDDLATVLFALDLRARTTRAVTRELTHEVLRWALANGWTPRVEARVQAGGSPFAATLGYVDVIVRRPDGQPDLVIEIDSTHKAWSLDKLRYAAGLGMHAIWIRWGDDEWAGIYDGVDVIQLWWSRQPARGRGQISPIALW